MDNRLQHEQEVMYVESALLCYSNDTAIDRPEAVMLKRGCSSIEFF